MDEYHHLLIECESVARKNVALVVVVVYRVPGSVKRQFPGLVNFVPALAYSALSAKFTQPGEHLLAEPCTVPDHFIDPSPSLN